MPGEPNTNADPADVVLSTPDLVCFWDLQEAGGDRVGRGPNRYRLREHGGRVERAEPPGGAVFGRYAARFAGGWRDGGMLLARRAECPGLDIHGPRAQVSVVAWVLRDPTPPDRAWQCQAVAGMWNEHSRRQYCLFLNLRIHESAEQVGAHVSAVGGPTPGFKYCMDAAIGATPVPAGRWQCAAISYDGEAARAYLNGRLDERGDRNPYRYAGGIFDGGPGGADFTVGAVTRPEKVTEDKREHGSIVGNRFAGLLGGLAVFRRALTAAEMHHLAALTPS
jgi:hypothetical protein